MGKKYEFTGEVNADGLKRIRALRDIPKSGVRAGDLGGWLEKEENLSHYYTCWVFNQAKVYNDAFVGSDALIFDTATICGNAVVGDEAQVFDEVIIRDSALVTGNAMLFSNATVCDTAFVGGNAEVTDNVIIRGASEVLDNVTLSGSVCVSGTAKIYKQAHYYEDERFSVGQHVGTSRYKADMDILESDSALAKELLKMMKHG